MRKWGKWIFSFRDALGREAVSGIWSLRNAPSSINLPVVARYVGSSSFGGYSLNIPIPRNNRLLSVNYYDDYSFLNDLVSSDTKRILSCDTLSNYGIPVVGTDKSKGFLTGTAVYSLTDPASKTVSSFYYDYQGRMIQSHRKEAVGGYGHIHQSLTFTGKPSRTRETVELPDGQMDSLVTVRAYDGQERLVSETTSLNGKSQSVSYGYDEIGRLVRRTYGTVANPSAFTENLTYNIRDQLTGLNSNVFNMSLRYQDPTLGAAPKYNGGVSEWEWNHGAGAETNAWSLSYDGVGRLTDARRFVGGAQTNSFSERSITYDRNSNALTLTRYGENAATPEEILAYSYDGNLLSGISNTGASGGGGQYTHDANGNMTHEGLSGLDIVYNEQNLTRRISSGGTTLAEYEYLADGTKLRALDGGGNGYQYRGSLIYAQTAGQTGSPVITLDCALTSTGRIVRETSAAGTVSYRPLIHLRDHLGSVRSVIDGDTGAVVETNDYYPFGKRIQVTAPVSEPVGGSLYAVEPAVAPVAPVTSVASTSSPNRWHFSGKESQSILNVSIPLLDFGARMYNPAIARWTAADPLSEKYYGISPYAYCANNAICLVDPTGKDWYSTTDSEGNILYHYNDNIYSQKDLDKAGIKGQYEGIRFKDGNTYYSLFGETVQYLNNKGIPTFEGQIYERLDNLIINDYTQENSSQSSWDTELPVEPKEDFYFPGLSPGEYSIQYNGIYEGKSFNNTRSGSIFHSRDKAHSQLRIYQMPPSESKRYGGYGLGYGEDKWFGCFMILTNGMRDHTLHINYTPENAKLLKAAINKQFNNH